MNIYKQALIDIIQAHINDMEQGVRWLNDIAASEFTRKNPDLTEAFNKYTYLVSNEVTW